MFRFYLVEDDALIRDGLRTCFPWSSMGAEVVGTADNGETAFREILQDQIDVVITDVVMPRMSGIELASALRKEGWDGELLMISAYQDVQYLREALKAQAVDFLFKPMQMSELTESVKRAIQRRTERKHSIPYAETAILKAMDAALSAYDGKQLEACLLSAWRDLRQTNRTMSEYIAETKRLLRHCGENIFLPDVEKKAEAVEQQLESAGDVDALEGQFHTGIAEIVHMLREHGKDWRYSTEITRCIEQNLMIADANFLASYLHVSRASFYRIFSRIFQENLSDYILKIRMRTACSLLQNADLRIYEIASRVGYSDVNYFTRQFRQIFGVLPTEYRTTRKNDDN